MRDTLPRYLDQNPHTIIALGYFSNEPTRDTLKAIQPYLTHGSVLAFDQLVHAKVARRKLPLYGTPLASITATCDCCPAVPHRPVYDGAQAEINRR